MNEFDEFSSSLSDEASSIAVEPTSVALDQVRGGASRRRRRRRALAGSVSALALLAGGLVAVNAITGDSGSDSLSIAGPDDEAVIETTTTTTSLAPEGAGSEAAATDAGTAAPADAPAVEVGATGVATPVNVVEQAAISVAGPPGDDGYTEWLVAWADGFLSARRSFTAQALPAELPEEVAALFPQEVLDLFEGGLPPTIQEATTMLSDAGLLEVVTAVLAEHPEASDAIYSEPVAEPTYEVLFTTNGDEWSPVEFALPDGVGEIRNVQSTGSRLAVLSQVQTPSNGSLIGSPSESGAISLSTTTDLVNWDVMELSDDDRPIDLPDVLAYSLYPQGLAINGDGWVVTAFGSVDVRLDVIGELVPEIGAAAQSGGGLGYGFDEQGINISIDSIDYDGDGNPLPSDPEGEQEFTVTWNELGVDPAAVPDQSANDSSMWAASWGASPVGVDSAPFDVVAADDGFYGTTDKLHFSLDGVTWTELTSPVENFGVQAPLSIGDGVAVILMTEDDSIIYRVSGATDTWEPIDLAGLPDNLSGNFGNSGAVWFLVPQDLPEPISFTIDVDGYSLTLSDVFPLTSVLLVDAAGNKVVDETWNRRSDDDPGIIEYTSRGTDVVDPDSGEVIVSIDNDVMEAAYREAYPIVEESYDPDVWMLATIDGDNWVVDHLGQSPDGEFYGPGANAINGSIVLISNGPQWERYEL